MTTTTTTTTIETFEQFAARHLPLYSPPAAAATTGPKTQPSERDIWMLGYGGRDKYRCKPGNRYFQAKITLYQKVFVKRNMEGRILMVGQLLEDFHAQGIEFWSQDLDGSWRQAHPSVARKKVRNALKTALTMMISSSSPVRVVTATCSRQVLPLWFLFSHPHLVPFLLRLSCTYTGRRQTRKEEDRRLKRHLPKNRKPPNRHWTIYGWYPRP